MHGTSAVESLCCGSLTPPRAPYGSLVIRVAWLFIPALADGKSLLLATSLEMDSMSKQSNQSAKASSAAWAHEAGKS